MLFKDAKNAGDKEQRHKRDNDKITLAPANKKLKAAIETNAKNVYLSFWTLRTHIKKHPEIDVSDYHIVKYMLDKPIKIKQSKKYHVMWFARLGYAYRAVFKRTEDDREIYLVSLSKGEMG